MALRAECLGSLAAIYPQSRCDPYAVIARDARCGCGVPCAREAGRVALGCMLGVEPSIWNTSRSKPIIVSGGLPGATSFRVSQWSIDRAITSLDDRPDNAFERECLHRIPCAACGRRPQAQ